MKLTEYAKNPYTLQEHQFFDLLPKDGKKISVNDLVRERKKRGAWKTRYPNHVVSVVMRHLIEKSRANRESFTIKYTEQRSGSQEKYYWLESGRRTRASFLD